MEHINQDRSSSVMCNKLDQESVDKGFERVTFPSVNPSTPLTDHQLPKLDLLFDRVN